jgi:signal transduction histidine kinase
VHVHRYPAAVEAAAYFAVAEVLGDATRRRAGHASVTVVHDDGQLAITVEDNGYGDVSPIAAAADRVGALGGTLSVEAGRCRIEVPCV